MPAIGPHDYAPNTVVDISATPAGGYRFVNWTSTGGAVANPTSPSTTVTVEASKTVTAHFELIPIVQSIILPPGWRMISGYIEPENLGLLSLTANLSPHLLIMKNGLAQVYWPALSINQIGDWNIKHGYQIYLTELDTLILEGDLINPQTTPINLVTGWNMSAYLRNAPMPIATALAGIVSNLAIVKNGAAKIYWPALGINSIGSMQPGEGYQLFVNQACVLTYQENSLPKESLQPVTALPSCVHFNKGTSMTGSNAILVWRNLSFADGDEIAAFTVNGQMVGSGAVQDGQALLAVWGDNAITEIRDGALADEALSLRHWSRNDDAESEIRPEKTTDALTGQTLTDKIRYIQDGALIMEGVQDDEIDLALDYQLTQNYPNPFNPTTVVRFTLPKAERIALTIYNARGECIRALHDGSAARGIHSILWDGKDELGRMVPAGIYFLRMSCSSFSKVVKMSFIK